MTSEIRHTQAVTNSLFAVIF